MKNENPTILIVKYRALGDSVMGLSTISYLRSIYPDSKIYYGVRAWTAALYKKVKLDADEVLEIKLETFTDFIKLFFILYKLKINHVHELHLSGRTKKFFSIAKYVLGFKYTYHNHHLKSGEVLDQGAIKPLIQRDLDGVFTFLGKKMAHPNFLDWEPSFKIGASVKERRIIFGVVATRATKMWSLDYFVELSKKIKELDSSIEIVVPLSNSKDDLKIEKELSEIDKGNLLKVVRVPLYDLPDFFSKSLFYVGNDTGLKHIAIAASIKAYTMFGPEPAWEWHPYSAQKHPYFYIDGLECRTRVAHYCGLNTCESMICMSRITVDNVFEVIKKDIV